MSSDRELLELAAKAAGFYYIEISDSGVCSVENRPGNFIFWNPITDDGDALRLAVKLGLKLEKHEAYYPYFSAEKVPDVFIAEDVIKNGGDELAATRRAIVRAAAEIGRSL